MATLPATPARTPAGAHANGGAAGVCICAPFSSPGSGFVPVARPAAGSGTKPVMHGGNDGHRPAGGNRRPPATPEQLAARERDHEARTRTAERKVRTRKLIQVGGVMAAWGITEPDQAEELMRALTSEDRKAWRRYLLGTLGARRTERWPER